VGHHSEGDPANGGEERSARGAKEIVGWRTRGLSCPREAEDELKEREMEEENAPTTAAGRAGVGRDGRAGFTERCSSRAGVTRGRRGMVDERKGRGRREGLQQ
jgi:hypothetical protein